MPDGSWPPQLNFPPDHSWKPVKPREQSTSAKNQRETIGTIKTDEKPLKRLNPLKPLNEPARAYLRRQTKEVEINNRWPPIIHCSNQILENTMEWSFIFWFHKPTLFKLWKSSSKLRHKFSGLNVFLIWTGNRVPLSVSSCLNLPYFFHTHHQRDPAPCPQSSFVAILSVLLHSLANIFRTLLDASVFSCS